MPDTTPDDSIAAWLTTPEQAARISPTPDLAELRRLAEAATPGPWEADGLEVCQHWSLPEPWRAVVNAEITCGPYCYGGSARPIERDEDAAFIAAANPSVVLALLDAAAERDALAAKVERLTGELVDAGYRQAEDRAEIEALRSQLAGRCLSDITHRDEEHRQSFCMLPAEHAPLAHDDCMGCTWTDADHWQAIRLNGGDLGLFEEGTAS